MLVLCQTWIGPLHCATSIRPPINFQLSHRSGFAPVEPRLKDDQRRWRPVQEWLKAVQWRKAITKTGLRTLISAFPQAAQCRTRCKPWAKQGNSQERIKNSKCIMIDRVSSSFIGPWCFMSRCHASNFAWIKTPKKDQQVVFQHGSWSQGLSLSAVQYSCEKEAPTTPAVPHCHKNPRSSSVKGL